MPAAMAQQWHRRSQVAAATVPASNPEDATAELASGKTIVLDVEEGGIQVPSFLGKNLRGALDGAQDAGLDLDAIGSGVAREQSPQAGRTSRGRSQRGRALRKINTYFSFASVYSIAFTAICLRLIHIRLITSVHA